MSEKSKSFIKKIAVSAAAAAVTAAAVIPPYCMFKYAVQKGRTFKLSDAFKSKDSESKRNMLKVKRNVRKLKEREFEEVSVTSFDGLKLFAKYYRNPKETDRLIICMHGYRSNDCFDFASAFDYFFENGFNVLLVSQRAHGKSEGKYITFGEKERFDCKTWAEYAAKRFGIGCEIVLDGVSMGATTVLLASSLELPHNVKAIIADCGFTSAWDILEQVMRISYKLPAFPYLYLTNAVSKLLAHFDFRAANTASAVALTDIPVFFAHGASDRFVPCSMTIKAFDACASDKKLLIVPGAGHAMSYIKSKDEYENAVGEFLAKYLSPLPKESADLCSAEAKI